MKKLIAILLSVLMLCSMIPFATVSAEDIPTIVAATVETAKAGDEIEVTVTLKNNPGIVGAKVEIDYDRSVMELMTHEVYDEEWEEYYDEVYIEMATGWSSDYVTFGQNGKCLVVFTYGTAKKDITKELFFTAHFKIKDGAEPGTYPLTVVHENKNMKNKAKQQIDFAAQSTSITIEGDEPTCEHSYFSACDTICEKCGQETRPEAGHNVTHVDAKPATCTELGNIEYWCCDVCGMAWLDEACTLNTNRFAIILPMAEHTYFDACSPICDVCGYEREVSHNVIHVAAKAPTCTELGNIEYWYCDACGAAWLDAECTMNTNQMAVKLGATCSTNAIYTAANAATCTENGNVEYWYCANCDVFYLDAACTVITNAKNVVVPASCSYNAVKTEAKAATCDEPGNVEYWYCANCDVYYLDAACTVITNAKSVILPIAHNVIHVEAAEANCTENGNIEYWYCDICGAAWLDELCHLNTNLKAVILPSLGGHTYDADDDAVCNVCGEINDAVEYKIVTYSGSSVAEDKNGVSGLAFLFNMNVADVAVKEGTIKEAAYDGSSVVIGGVKYDLKGMGAMVSNNGQIATSLDENANLINIPAKWLYNLEAFSASFAVRVINIPEVGYDVDVTATPYLVYEADGVEVIYFGDSQVNSVNKALN